MLPVQRHQFGAGGRTKFAWGLFGSGRCHAWPSGAYGMKNVKCVGESAPCRNLVHSTASGRPFRFAPGEFFRLFASAVAATRPTGSRLFDIPIFDREPRLIAVRSEESTL